jgi:hypothetical protein
MRNILFRLAPLVFLGACAFQPDDAPPPAPGVDVQALLAAPGEIEIEGRTLTLEGIAWRDFMPGVGAPDENGLIVIGRVEDPEQGPLPAGVEIVKLWVVQGHEVWSPAELEHPPQAWAWRHEKVGRDGPLWDPTTTVHVIVRLTDGENRTWWLRNTTQIFSTW